jgi:hypothetical protein
MIVNLKDVYLNTKQILELISEQSIYEHYLGINIKDNKLYKCPIHDDHNPSLGFYINSHNNLTYNCFGCGSKGNVFEFVKQLYNIDFKESVIKVQNDLKLKSNNINNKIINTSNNFVNNEFFSCVNEITRKTEIIPTFKPFNKIDYDYWNQFNISLELLLKYDIKSCKLIYIVNKLREYKLWAEYTDKEPIYSYQIDDSFKIYRPFSSKSGKWLSTTDLNDIQGIKQLPIKGELLIITSSMKDVLVLNVMGYNAIALGGEGNNIPEKILDYLWACFDNIVVFYDNDRPGLKYGKKFSKQIGASNIFIPVEFEDTKDISDFVKKYTLEKGINLMKQLI